MYTSTITISYQFNSSICVYFCTISVSHKFRIVRLHCCIHVTVYLDWLLKRVILLSLKSFRLWSLCVWHKKAQTKPNSANCMCVYVCFLSFLPYFVFFLVFENLFQKYSSWTFSKLWTLKINHLIIINNPILCALHNRINLFHFLLLLSPFLHTLMYRLDVCESFHWLFFKQTPFFYGPKIKICSTYCLHEERKRKHF